MTEFKTSNNHDDKVVSQPISDFHIEEDEHFSYNDYKIEDWLAFILFWLLAFTVFSQFISRYLLSAPLGWTEEIARYQLVCLGFIGACIGIRKNTHIYVALFHRWLPTKLSHTIYTFIAVFNVVFIAYLAFFAWQIIPKLHIHKMASISVSISVIYGIIFASLLIMLLRSGQYLGSILTKTENLSNRKATNKLN